MTDWHVNFRIFFFADHSKPIGRLDHDRRAQAAWYYVTCGHRNLALATAGATYEGELDTPVLLGNIARGVAMFYGIQDPAEMLKFIPQCKQEAARCGFEWDERIEKPDPTRVSRKVSVQ